MPWILNPFTSTLEWVKDTDVLAHKLGGEDHIEDTLENLNSKISDGTLIDTGDSRLSDDRDPTAHAASHSDGTDDVDVDGGFFT